MTDARSVRRMMRVLKGLGPNDRKAVMAEVVAALAADLEAGPFLESARDALVANVNKLGVKMAPEAVILTCVGVARACGDLP